MKKEQSTNYGILLLYAIFLLPLSLAGQSVKEYPDSLTISSGNVHITVLRRTGKVDYRFSNGVILSNTVAAFRDEQYGYFTSTSFHQHTARLVRGELIIEHTDAKLPLRLVQHIKLNKDHLLLQAEAIGHTIATRHIAPLAVIPAEQGACFIPGASPRILDMPFDNDNWVSAVSRAWPDAAGASYEVAAVYDKDNFSGFVTGSVEHDRWKTGIIYKTAMQQGALDSLYVYGGAASVDNNKLPPLYGGLDGTHDHAPHGILSGSNVSSPLVYLAAGDIRTALKGFGNANVAQAGALKWKGYAPFYWNSFGVEGVLGYHKIMMPDGVKQVSDFLHTLKNFSKYAPPVLSIDSYDQGIYSTAVLDSLGQYAKTHRQEIGFYFIPFALWTWENAIDREILQGTGVPLKEIVLRDSANNPIAYKKGEWGAYAIDPTHPAVRQYIILQLMKAKAIHATFLKIDFLTAGSLESTVRYDKNVKTGMQAYSGGMKMLKHLADSILGKDIFITMAISPMFPHQYAHTRFVSTDVYSHLRDDQPGFPHYGSTEASLAAGSHMWWMQGTLWPYTNADVTIMKKFQGNPELSEQEIKVRIYAMMAMGSIFGDGSDLRDSLAAARARKYLDNPEICSYFSAPEAFLPLQMADKDHPDQQMIFYKAGKTPLLGLFNFDTQHPFEVSLPVETLTSGQMDYSLTDLLTGRQVGKIEKGQKSITINVPVKDALMLKLQPLK